MLELVGLDADRYGPRYPSQLSGGEAQRVGVARALASDPPVLLMDEPFSAVDPVNRLRLQNEFLAIQRRLRKTVVFVTHDVDEAIRLADRIAVLRAGALVQYDAPEALLDRPADAFIAGFLGSDRALKRLSRRAIRDWIRPAKPARDDEDLASSALRRRPGLLVGGRRDGEASRLPGPEPRGLLRGSARDPRHSADRGHGGGPRG